MQSLFESSEPRKTPSWVHFLPVALMTIVMVVAIFVFVRHHHAELKAAWEAERATAIYETEIRLSVLKSEITLADQKRLAILKERKPRKVAGIEIPQPLLPEQQQRYDAVVDQVARLQAAYQQGAREFNKLLEIYTGPWPEGEGKRPTPIPVNEGQ